VRAVAYARVSTTEQAAEGVSLDAQEAALRAYCTRQGLDLVRVVVDAGVSASQPLAKRPGGREVLDMVVRREVGAVVAVKLDRLFRDALDCLSVTREWDRRGVALHLIDINVDTSTAMGRLFLTLMAAVAEMERNLIGERTAAALAHVKAQGVQLGAEALGWRRTDAPDAEGRLGIVSVVSESETVDRIVELRRERHTLRAIAERLVAEGRPTKKGGGWHPSTVRAVLRRAGGLGAVRRAA
jgi:DNA invertase Pin-like site-specific DNA recombinase